MTELLEGFFLAVVRASWHASVVIVLVLALRRLVAPEQRLWLWALVLVRLALPFSVESASSFFNLDPIQPELELTEAQPFEAGLAPEHTDTLPARPAPRSPEPSASQPASTLGRTSFTGWGAWVWSSGALLFVLLVVVSQSKLARRVADARAPSDAALREVAAQAAREVGLRRAPEVLESAGVAAPCVVGFVRPRVLMPPGVGSRLTPEQLRLVFLHEFEHVRRRDVALNWTVTVLHAVHWFNPLVWIAAALFRADRELACDAHVLSRLGKADAPAYGAVIVSLVESLARQPSTPGIAGIGEDARALKLRLRAIARFGGARPRRRLTAVAVVSLLAAVTLTDARTRRDPTTAEATPLLSFLPQACSLRRERCACDQRELAEHRTRIRAAQRRGSTAETLLSEYRALLEQHPGDPVFEFLYGELLVTSRQFVEARRVLEGVVAAGHEFPWPHLGLGRLETISGNREAAVRHLEQFARACPCNPEGLALLVRVVPAETAPRYLDQLREALSRDFAPADLHHFYMLWHTELEVTPVHRHAEVRRHIEADLARLRKLGWTAESSWWSTLEEGYRQAWDPAGLKWTLDGRVRHLRNTPEGFRFVQQRWYRENLPPDDPADAAGWAAHRRKYLGATAAWAREFPGDADALLARFSALMREPAVPVPEIEPVARALLGALEKAPDRSATPVAAQAYLAVARFHVKRGIELDGVPELVRKASESPTPPNTLFAQGMRFDGRSTLIKAYLAMKRFDQARTALAEMEHMVDSAEPKSSWVTSWKSQLEVARGEIAEAEGRKADALAAYQRRLRSQRFPVTSSPLLETAHRLWTELRRPEAQWQSFVDELEQAESKAQAALAPRWEEVRRPLPQFRVTDVQGRPWALEDLKGRTTLMHVWAVWASRQGGDLATVQQIYQRLKGRSDVVFLTLNADEYTAQVPPFLAARDYTFPVVPAYRYVQSLFPFTGPAMIWIVDRDGVVRAVRHGPLSGANLDEVLARVDAVARGG